MFIATEYTILIAFSLVPRNSSRDERLDLSSPATGSMNRTQNQETKPLSAPSSTFIAFIGFNPKNPKNSRNPKNSKTPKNSKNSPTRSFRERPESLSVIDQA
jgi:hypothetical protein